MASHASGGFVSTLATNKDRFRKTLISDQVYELLRQAVVEGDLAPNDRVVESEIARRLGVSQAPVREAVKRLAREGLLTHVPRRGHFVVEISAKDAEYARQVREPLEGLAARLAAEHITEEQLAELDALVERMHEAVATNDVSGFRDADIGFHTLVSQFAGNPFLARMWEVIEPSLRTLRAISDPLFDGDWCAMADEHGRLVGLLRSGDPAEAAEAFADHAAGRGPVPDARQTKKPRKKAVAKKATPRKTAAKSN
ncbi:MULTISPECIES: GntR family transcriptional regulator [unclassified Streptomyces]|jgi:DNA-binding GntR family transcriptional regulator|uniref:GntR family transcriptional regulator n=2 Tax=Streptomyces TaxID=1883 RepID=UPI00081B29F4|nr:MULTISPECIES: GntR family transcriptional regulator [unclassified Streptomyces]MYQ86248.1 FCD domain-containing protein [Streptomyces sp. SID4936]SCE19407.1 transcriptional regulator, GntR family [Streptomyces sp. DvalAA-43]